MAALQSPSSRALSPGIDRRRQRFGGCVDFRALAGDMESPETRIYRGGLDIGGVERVHCRDCQIALLVAIWLVEEEQRRGIDRALADLAQREPLLVAAWLSATDREARCAGPTATADRAR